MLRCRADNQQRARIDFGEPHMARFHRTGFESSSPQATGDVLDRKVPASPDDSAGGAPPRAALEAGALGFASLRATLVS